MYLTDEQRRDATQMRDFTTGVNPFGALAPARPATPPAAEPRASLDRNVLTYLRTGSAGPTPPAALLAWAKASFARRSPSREVRNPSRVPQ